MILEQISGFTHRGAALAMVLVMTASLIGGFSEAAAQIAPDSVEAEPLFTWDPNDPRLELGAGWMDAESAIRGLEQVSEIPRPDGFFNPATPDDGRFSNTDLAFEGQYLYQGNYNGFQIYDLEDPNTPMLALSVVCPGGQGDVSVYGDLVFMSAQETRGRLDCGIEGVTDSISAERMRGVRIFDVSDLSNPMQVAAIQSCRGSHTHTLVIDPDDSENVYVYIQGTSSVRPTEELPGCSGGEPDEDPNTALFRIEVVRVPLNAPENAEIINMPRIFADAETGNIAGLWAGGDHGAGTQDTRRTHQCHDITVYPEIGLAAGACSGNGILLDISDVVNPRRIDEVLDPNFAYWHSATFNNGGTKVVFTDEWGGGGQARCRASDPPTWGANAIFTIEDGEMTLGGYYKLPVPQTETENCVAHNGSIIPVPGRDLMVQAWYQGGLSIMDFTDPANAFEVAFFDRGPLSAEALFTGGYWSTYWHNGRIYGAEISRGIDVFRLTPTEHLSQAEIDAAELIQIDQFNAQMQPLTVWPAVVPVARAYLDQLVRGNGILNDRVPDVANILDRAERGTATATQLAQVAAQLDQDAIAIRAGTRGGDAERLSTLAEVLRNLGG
ncbi:MAG: hypothetical protein CME09_01590 [Gemmatimonadetes bacterium]|nr:hypothetical protein [Gemmatimonadota bacterium]